MMPELIDDNAVDHKSDPYQAPDSTSEYLLCESDQVNFGGTGWRAGWPNCREMVYGDCIEFALLTRTIHLPMSSVQLLKSTLR